ncbi:MAG: C40 family peptidase [Bacteroidia bacterium]
MKLLQSISLTLLLSTFTVSAYAQSGNGSGSASQKVSALQTAIVAETALTAIEGAPETTHNDVAFNEAPREKTKGGPNKIDGPKKKTKKKVEVVEQPEADFSPEPQENYFARQIVNNALQFEGVRYRGGGTTTAGMDCSGMVFATFKLFDWTLPRSSASMADGAGKEIDLKEARIGDLLFFDNSPYKKRINHVGIVTEVTETGEVKFIHATLSHGVAISSMNDNYYIRTFVQINRVIED